MSYLIFTCISFILIQWTSGNIRVYYGEAFRPYLHRHLVYLGLYARNNEFSKDYTSYSCSGSILSKRWIISAAHCFDANIEIFFVQRLEYYRVIEIAYGHEYKKFPNYIPEKTGTDLALLKTTENILFDGNTQPIKLAETRPKIGQGVIVAGYGTSEIGDSIPRQGRALLTKCSDADPTVLCTFGTMSVGEGDSGGPLVSNGQLVGITSSTSCVDVFPGDRCESHYVEVSQHLNWIRNVTDIQ